MAKPRTAIRNYAEYVGARLATMGLDLFTIDQNMATARVLGKAVYYILRNKRRQMHAGIARSFPSLNQQQVERIALRSVENLIQLMMEMLFSTRLIHCDNWASRIHIREMQPALDLLLQPKPVIMVTAHFGNWELVGNWLATEGINLEAVARPLDNPLLNEWLYGIRARRGMRIITKYEAAERMLELMRNGGTLAFIADQNAGDRGMFVPFFGRLASAYKSIGLLAMRYEVPVICGYARRLGDVFEYEVGTSDIIYPHEWAGQPDPLYYITARWCRAIETMIRLDPEQYWWIHRRWKSRPTWERAGKPMPRRMQEKLLALPWVDQADLEQLCQPLTDA